jgi:hypothetical protein
MQPFKRHFIVGQTSEIGYWPVWITIDWDGKKLSFTGVEGPRGNGDALGSCGQIDISAINPELAELWKRWHLNNMRPGCEHQRELWNTDEEVEVVSYKLSTEAYQLRNKTLGRITDAWLKKEKLQLTEKEFALAGLDNWFKSVYQLPDNVLKECYVEEKREIRRIGWVYPTEHPRGVLLKPCPMCGYKYGEKWLHEEVPEEVLEKLATYPDQTKDYPWRSYA